MKLRKLAMMAISLSCIFAFTEVHSSSESKKVSESKTVDEKLLQKINDYADSFIQDLKGQSDTNLASLAQYIYYIIRREDQAMVNSTLNNLIKKYPEQKIGLTQWQENVAEIDTQDLNSINVDLTKNQDFVGKLEIVLDNIDSSTLSANIESSPFPAIIKSIIAPTPAIRRISKEEYAQAEKVRQQSRGQAYQAKRLFLIKIYTHIYKTLDQKIITEGWLKGNPLPSPKEIENKTYPKAVVIPADLEKTLEEKSKKDTKKE